MTPSLHDLGEKYGVDKLHSHSYIPLYEQLFSGREVRRLLEIGVGYEELMKPFVPFYVHGASLRMFRDFFPGAQIWGCDIRPDVLIWEPPIFCLQIDQSKREDLESLVALAEQSAPWDIIIDDGSHQTEHQILTAEVLLPTVRKGGVYVVEDCQRPEEIITALGCGMIHRFDKRPDDCLVVFER